MENERKSNSDLTGKVLAPLFLVLIFSLIQLFRLGFSRSDYLALLIGSILSTVVVFLYALLPTLFPAGKKSLIASLIAFSDFIPYLFSIYLVFYKGLWNLRLLSDDFSFITIFSSAFFILVG